VKKLTTPSLSDRNFDDLSDRFSERIYDSEKGRIRLELIQQDLASVVVDGKPLKVLDVGGGQGQMSAWLHDLGHEVTLVDLSENMMDSDWLNQRPGIRKYCMSAQDYLLSTTDSYDLVLCHAVLEWLVKPFALLPLLGSRLKRDGCLSVIFYNKNALIMTHAQKGNWNRLSQERERPFKTKGLTPQYPLLPEEVEDAWPTTGCTLTRKRGIRVFHDYVEKEERHQLSPELSLAVEAKWGLKEPWWRLGRYIHFMGVKTKAVSE